jgi:hypothetical protein
MIAGVVRPTSHVRGDTMRTIEKGLGRITERPSWRDSRAATKNGVDDFDEQDGCSSFIIIIIIIAHDGYELQYVPNWFLAPRSCSHA